MIRMLLRRAGQAILSLFVVITVTFFIGRLSGKPGALLLGPEATQLQKDRLNEQLGFNRPVINQYGSFLRDLLHLDFGDSYREPGTSSMSIVWSRVPATAELAVTAFVAGIVLAVIAATAIHLTRGRMLRTLLLWLGSIRLSVPDFLFGVLLVLVFSVKFNLFPSLGRQGARSLVLPALTVATGQFVLYLRLLDNSLGDQRTMDYVRTAYAKGETKRRVVLAEMLPNALLPVLTIAGINLGILLGGIVIVENVFSWPGLGQLLLDAVAGRDFPVVQAGIIFVAAFFILSNLLVDLVYGLIDPRVRAA